MFEYNSIGEIAAKAVEAGRIISELVIEDQVMETGRSSQELYEEMEANLQVMKEAVKSGIEPSKKSNSGLSGGDAYKLKKTYEEGRTLSGKVFTGMMVKALAVSEYNACMGRIVAAPTAGSCGIIPAVLLTAMEEKSIPEEKVVNGLFTAAGIGLVIANIASISGAQGGCQAECGSASAMAAGALVEILGGSPQMVVNACAIALKNVLGLVCDPVGGMVEVPCIKRNAMGAANALLAADMAIAGIESIIPADEVIGAMKAIGNLMSTTLKETAMGGLASTPTGLRLAKKIKDKVD